MTTIRYNAVPALRRPATFIAAMWHDLLACRELAWRLFLRDLKGRYRASILGYIWAILPPLAVTATFLLLQKSKVMNVGEMEVPYALFVLTGSTFWQLFADAAHSPLRMITNSRGLLVKINFPREALILCAALESLFTFLIRLGILTICLPLFGVSLIDALPGLALAPVAAIGLLIPGLAIGVLLTPLGVLFQDFSHGLPLMLSVWLIATPIAYPASRASGMLHELNRINPISPLIEFPRSMLLDGHLGSFTPWLVVTSIALVAAFISWCLFRLALPHIIARAGS